MATKRSGQKVEVQEQRLQLADREEAVDAPAQKKRDKKARKSSSFAGSLEHGDLVDQSKQPVSICVWVPKGGCGKTTFTFHISRIFAERGYKVLMVDCDSQRDLSQISLRKRFDEETEYQEDYTRYITREGPNKTSVNRTLYQMLQPLISQNLGEYRIAEANPEVILEKTDKGGCLHLLAGHHETDVIDSKLASHESTIQTFPQNAELIGGVYAAIQRVAQNMKADIIICDLAPGKGPFTRALMMSSDYYIVPVKPDFYSYEAVTSIVDRMTRNPEGATGFAAENHCWIEYAHTYLVPMTAKCKYPFPKKSPKFLGYVITDYSVHIANNGQMAQGVVTEQTARNRERWMNAIHTVVNRRVTDLVNFSLTNGDRVSSAFEVASYNALNVVPYLVGKVRSFETLQSISHIWGVPVPFLDKDKGHFVRDDGFGQLEPMNGRDIPTYVAKCDFFKRIFDQIAWTMLSLIHSDNGPGRCRIKEPEDLLKSKLGGRPPPSPLFFNADRDM
ncbi:hypothetical protein GUITHDRAFT_106719 [Guillardia theta CCMP2712]|uniref:AAA domain-containing protein n=1 Tax=Guillardia theta (strain CCMP2712) TaxID=905079 RepID=L1JGM7_GUITC|nr:hypothetical protein GUITHDRAFT_106719 [Guillardia theta CCMP2712]EKX47269.1 hypothetical protein GUITHDRAFT_106719 [Guillardia theta CCMP2712]|eukprot:XP_005834249.1 hypothetical protein GUITHDRAFT_106719 [Guillardia theta CCMP2712]